MPSRRTSVATALAAVLVVVGVLAAALAGPLSLQARPSAPLTAPVLTPPPVTQTAPPEPLELPEDTPDDLAWVAWAARVVIVLVLVVGVVLVALLLRYVARGWRLDRRGPDEDDVTPGDDEGDVSATAVAALREGVAAATRALDEDVPPGDAVIGAWVAVETAAARTGVVRDRAQTASEFTVDVLDATRADPAATRDLLALYLAARFGAHPVTAADVRRARDLLAVVAQGLVPRRPDAPDDDAPDGTAP